MGFLKKNIKWIVLVIVLMVIVSGVSVYATSRYLASDISYNSTNVASALNDLYSVSQIGVGNHYSTNEQVVGTWVDGKPLYQKTITGLNITLGWNDKYFAYNGSVSPLVDNVDKIISGIGYGSNFSMPVTVSTGTNWGIRGVDTWTINAITLQYTKTTDTAKTN